MKLTTFILSIFISATTAVIVAILTHWLTKKREETKSLQNLRVKSYSDFFRSFIDFALIDNKNNEMEAKYRAQLENAHLRILLYGDDTVIHEIAEFWRIFETALPLIDKCDKEQRKNIEHNIAEKLIPIIVAIRKSDFKLKNNVLKDDVKLLILWGDMLDYGELPKAK